MKIETLNKIKQFAEQPSAEELASIMTQFDSVIEEEFFWISISKQNKTHIYKLLIDYDKTYFIDSLIGLKQDVIFSQIQFRIFRFLIEVSKESDKKNVLFVNLNETTLYLIDIINDSLLTNKQQIMFFISEIILELPLEFIDRKHVSFLSNFSLSSNISFIGSTIIEKFIPRIIENKNAELLLKVLDRIVFSIDTENYKNESHRTGYDGYSASRILNENIVLEFSKLIGENKLLDFTISKISAIIERVPYNFSHLGISTIEDSSQILDKDKYEYILIKFLRIQLEVNQFTNSVIESLLNSKYGIFKRLAVFYLNKNYEKDSDIFWRAATSDFLVNPEIKHEVFMLLKNNANSINKVDFLTLNSSLDGMREIVINEKLSRKDIIYYNTYLAKEYLLALKDCKSDLSSNIKEKLKEIEEIVPTEISHPGYSTYFESGIAVDKNREEFSQNVNVTDLPALLDIAENGFQNMNERDALKLVNRINFLLRSNIPLILENQEKLIKIGLENFYELPNFFEKAWEDRIEIDWAEVFSFFGKVVNTNYSKNPKAYHSFIAYCSWLIRSTTKNDEHGLDGDALVAAKDLCVIFLNLRIENERLNADPFFDILNSTDGKIFDAVVNLLLRNARLNKTKVDNDKWFPDVKAFYTDTLNQGKQTDAMIWSISMYLPQFGYLDMNWLSEHIHQIFPKEKNELWLLAMRGYHKFCNQVYKSIYDLLLIGGHYDMALTVFKDEQHGTDDVMEHIVMAYVANWPGSEIENTEGIIHKVLQNGNRVQIHGLINFFLKNKHFDNAKMLTLWKAILSSIAVRDKLVYNDLLLLVGELKDVNDESFELTKITLNNVTTNQVLFRFVTNLLELENANPINRAKLLLEIPESDFTIYFEREGFEKLAQIVISKDFDFGKEFIKKLIEKRLFNLLDIYNKSIR
jgi:hypothetical protein